MPDGVSASITTWNGDASLRPTTFLSFLLEVKATMDIIPNPQSTPLFTTPLQAIHTPFREESEDSKTAKNNLHSTLPSPLTPSNQIRPSPPAKRLRPSHLPPRQQRPYLQAVHNIRPPISTKPSQTRVRNRSRRRTGGTIRGRHTGPFKLCAKLNTVTAGYQYGEHEMLVSMFDD